MSSNSDSDLISHPLVYLDLVWVTDYLSASDISSIHLIPCSLSDPLDFIFYLILDPLDFKAHLVYVNSTMMIYVNITRMI